MREIKFRAWNIPKEQMATVFQIGEKHGEYSLLAHPREVIYCDPTDAEKQKDSNGYVLFKGQYYLMQYTGLLDRHAKEIYEGDVIHLTDKSKDSTWGTDEKKVIEFDGGAFRFDGMNIFEMKGYGGYPKGQLVFEIIGNIYENPELLK